MHDVIQHKGSIIYPPGHACDLQNKDFEVCMRGVALVKAAKMLLSQSRKVGGGFSRGITAFCAPLYTFSLECNLKS